MAIVRQPDAMIHYIKEKASGSSACKLPEAFSLCLVQFLTQTLNEPCLLLCTRCTFQKQECGIPPSGGELPPRIEVLPAHIVLHHSGKVAALNRSGDKVKKLAEELKSQGCICEGYEARDCFVDPSELLGGVFFLTDDKATSAVTGVVLPIDAGFSAYAGV